MNDQWSILPSGTVSRAAVPEQQQTGRPQFLRHASHTDFSCSPVTPDGVFLTSASKDGRPMLRNGETGDWIGTFQGHKVSSDAGAWGRGWCCTQRALHAACMHTSQLAVANCNLTNTLCMQGAVWACILNDAATIAATASADFSACVWNAITGDEMHKFAHGHIVRTLQLAHTKSQLITAGEQAA